MISAMKRIGRVATEPLRQKRTTKRDTKKSSAQLDREITEALTSDRGRSRASRSINPEYLRKAGVAGQLADAAWLRGGLDAMDEELKSLRRSGADQVIIDELERLYHRQAIRTLPEQRVTD